MYLAEELLLNCSCVAHLYDITLLNLKREEMDSISSLFFIIGFKAPTMQIIKSIQNRIYELRGERVMLDFDLAAFMK